MTSIESLYGDLEVVVHADDNSIVNSIIDESVSADKWIVVADGIRDKVAQVRKFRIDQVKSQIASLVANGISVDDLVDRKKAEPVYKDPTTGKTWSGHGKTPKWLATLISNGASKDSFRIVPLNTVEPAQTPTTVL